MIYLLSAMVLASMTMPPQEPGLNQHFDDGSSLNIQYDKDAKNLLLTVTLVDQSFVGLGFGDTMTNTEMQWWVADGENSQMYQGYSVTHGPPTAYDNNAWTSSFTTSENGNIVFSSNRSITLQGDSVYEIPLDEQIDLCWAWQTSVTSVAYHDSNYGNLYMRIQSDTGDVMTLMISADFDWFIVHGWVMFSSWMVFGLLMIASHRILRPYWKVNATLHAVMGWIVTLGTIGEGLWGMYKVNWEILTNFHSKIGVCVLATVSVVAIGGITAQYLKMFAEWQPKKVQAIRYIHSTLAFLLVCAAQWAVWSGIGHYWETRRGITNTAYEWVSVGSFYMLALLMELYFQYKQRQETEYTRSNKLIPIEEFEERVREGEELVILDDMVLNVKGFGFAHPGGAHVISHNIGRDISKFFYGGYVLANQPGVKPYKHSNIARETANNMIEGMLYEPTQHMICNIHQQKRLNNTTSVYTFKTHNGEKVKKLRNVYWDISMFGKHYLVRNMQPDSPSAWVKRQYTVSNCLNPMFYDSLLRLAADPEGKQHSRRRSSLNDNGDLKGDLKEFDQMLNGDMPTDTISMTIKNYDIQGGLSQKISQSSDNSSFLIQGPMGKGLGLGVDKTPSGNYVAFSAGTGMLPFIDLAAYLLLKNTDTLPAGQEYKFADDFCFHYYVSFQTEDDSIALRMLRGLEAICKNEAKPNFKLTVRIGSKGHARWDQDYIRQQLKEIGKVQRIWVCGPPQMQENFDKDLAVVAPQLNINLNNVDIL